MSGNSHTGLGKRWAINFFSIWTGQAFSLLGSQLVHFALIWWLTVQTGSATVLATASLAGILPQVILGPVAGVLVDRWSRRLVMMAADALVASATVILAILFAFDVVQVWHVYVILFVRALGGGFHWPAMRASTSLMVPHKHLTRVEGINQTMQGMLGILSAPLGALLLELLPIQSILAIDVGTALLAILPLFFAHVPQPQRNGQGDDASKIASIWMEMRDGLWYLKSWPGMFAVLFMATIINLVLNPAFALLPLLVKEHFQGGALHLAYMESGFGIGIIAGGVLLSVWGGFKRRMKTTLLGLVMLGISVGLIGLSPGGWFLVAVAAIFFTGVSLSLANGSVMAILQALVAPEMQGRILGLISSVSAAMSPLGLIVAGPAADLLGVQTWFLIAGAVTFPMAVIGFLIRSIYFIEDFKKDILVSGQESIAYPD